ncbi:MAG: hypothetical protein ACT4OI_02380 [Methanobacteriota archaeon]
MIRRRWLSALAFVSVLLVVASLAHVPRASAQAAVPSHAVGDAVGFGVTLDLAPFVNPLLDDLRQQVTMDPNTTINDLNFTGTLDIWHAENVVDTTSTQYTIRQNNAIGFGAHLRASVTSTMLPEAGVYQGDTTFGCVLPVVPTETRRVTANLDVTYLETSEGAANWSVSEFAVLDSYSNNALDVVANFVGRGLPEIESNYTTCQITVTYRDVSYRVTVDVDSALHTSYSPALDVFDFPIADGENWTVDTVQTTGGTLRGVIDVQGIDPEDERDLFDALNAALAATNLTVEGLDGFPIVLERISIAVGLDYYLRDGILDDTPSPVSMQLQARTRSMTLDGQPRTVYEISMYTPTPTVPYVACYYSPTHGFVVACALVADATSGATVFELENVPFQEAESNIETTRTTYVVSAPGNPLADFFLKFPYLGLLLLVAAVVVIAAFLSRRRAKPAPMAPPPAAVLPPQAPTPPAEEPSPEEL